MIRVIRESHDTPAFVAHWLTRAGGINRFGQPNYRAIWGWKRLAYIAGAEFTGRWEPKYWNAVNRWVIEKWCPPEMYGNRWLWEHRTVDEDGTTAEQLGPFPTLGDYELSWVAQTPNGDFLQLTPTIVEGLARRIEYGNIHQMSRRELYVEHQKKDDAYGDWAFEQMADTATWVSTPHVYPYQNVKQTLTGRSQ